MSPDDERHGTYAGSVEHYLTKTPTCQPCRDAAAAYRRDRRARLYLARTTSLEVDPIGSIRRIQALVRLGHSMRTIDDLVGWHHGTTSRFIVAKHKTTHKTTADRIKAAYEVLSMTVPDGGYALRNRRLGERKRWAPPLAWDDDMIDDPNARPHGNRFSHRAKTDIDPVAVDRAIAGGRVRLTRAERFEVVGRMQAAGWSLQRIEEQTGITRPDRYVSREAS